MVEVFHEDVGDFDICCCRRERQTQWGDSKAKVGMWFYSWTASSDLSELFVTNVVWIEDNVVQSF